MNVKNYLHTAAARDESERYELRAREERESMLQENMKRMSREEEKTWIVGD